MPVPPLPEPRVDDVVVEVCEEVVVVVEAVVELVVAVEVGSVVVGSVEVVEEEVVELVVRSVGAVTVVVDEASPPPDASATSAMINPITTATTRPMPAFWPLLRPSSSPPS